MIVTLIHHIGSIGWRCHEESIRLILRRRGRAPDSSEWTGPDEPEPKPEHANLKLLQVLGATGSLDRRKPVAYTTVSAKEQDVRQTPSPPSSQRCCWALATNPCNCFNKTQRIEKQILLANKSPGKTDCLTQLSSTLRGDIPNRPLSPKLRARQNSQGPQSSVRSSRPKLRFQFQNKSSPELTTTVTKLGAKAKHTRGSPCPRGPSPPLTPRSGAPQGVPPHNNPAYSE